MPIFLARVITGAAYLPFWLGSTAPLTMRTRHCDCWKERVYGRQSRHRSGLG